MDTFSDFKKGSVVELDGTHYIVMASVPNMYSPGNAYNICTTELLGSRYGINLEAATLMPTEMLSEDIKRRVKNFL